MKKKFIIGLMAIVLISGLCALGYHFKQPSFLFKASDSEPSLVTPEKTSKISYHGEAGKTALALLQDNYETVVSGSGEMAFVTSIEGRTADSTNNEFWEMLVNGKSAQVGAGSYVTKDSDIISWQLSKF